MPILLFRLSEPTGEAGLLDALISGGLADGELTLVSVGPPARTFRMAIDTIQLTHGVFVLGEIAEHIGDELFPVGVGRVEQLADPAAAATLIDEDDEDDEPEAIDFRGAEPILRNIEPVAPWNRESGLPLCLVLLDDSPTMFGD